MHGDIAADIACVIHESTWSTYGMLTCAPLAQRVFNLLLAGVCHPSTRARCIARSTSLRLPSQDGFDSFFFSISFARPSRIDEDPWGAFRDSSTLQTRRRCEPNPVSHEPVHDRCDSGWTCNGAAAWRRGELQESAQSQPAGAGVAATHRCDGGSGDASVHQAGCCEEDAG